jgi:ATP-binding cassette, subfamily C (CFTR/MRP), member 1
MIAPLATFAVYAIIPMSSEDENLMSAKAFASLSLISLVTFPLLNFCGALPNLVQAAACFGRIEEYLLMGRPSTTKEPWSTKPHLSSHVSLQILAPTRKDEQPLLSFENADIGWSPDLGPVLQDISWHVPAGLTAIVGPVAAGKSTLLWSMLDETMLFRGSMSPTLSGVAFCAQTPWIMDDTVRENITLGMSFEETWYRFSMFCCCLEQDLALLPQGDQTVAGTDGSALSGGQRQRIVCHLFECSGDQNVANQETGPSPCRVFETTHRNT